MEEIEVMTLVVEEEEEEEEEVINFEDKINRLIAKFVKYHFTYYINQYITGYT